MDSNILSSRPTFDDRVLKRGAVIRVESKVFNSVMNSHSWNALVLKVKPFELVIAKIPGNRRGLDDDDGGVEKQTLHIDSVVNKDTKIELLRAP